MDAETLARVAALEREVKAIKAHLNMLPYGQDTKAICDAKGVPQPGPVTVDLRGAHMSAPPA